LTPEERDQIDPRIREAAEGMEAVFLDYLMKTMRETVPKNDMDLENSGTRIYRAMLDSELAEKSAKQGGIGLADEIIAYLQRQQYNKDGVSTPAASTGGTNASRPARK
jgi:flagellar protein FlgJ